MISYAPLWKTMKEKHATTYTLQKNGISSATIRNMKAGKSVSLHTVDTLCKILDCDIQDVAVYIPDPNP